MRSPAPPLPVTDEQRSVLEKLMRSQTAPHRDVQRATALVMASDGFANTRIAREIGVSPTTVVNWRERFAEDGLKWFSSVRSGRGRKPSIPPGKVEEIVRLTLQETPRGETQWSCRTMAELAGVSPATVQRIWSARGLAPHRVETFKLSGDPRFEEKLVDVVGLYLNPPENAMVLCMDEKSQIQALDRTQPSLPMKPGRAGTMTHDYKRHGTTTLFAALNVATGQLMGKCFSRHRHEEFLA
ncbi:MAG: IS630 family transposase, partial [Solirubrobacteraceae bacterium]